MRRPKEYCPFCSYQIQDMTDAQRQLHLKKHIEKIRASGHEVPDEDDHPETRRVE